MIKILVMELENAGVGKFRFNDPHVFLQNIEKTAFHIDIVQNPPLTDKNYMSKYNMVFVQSSMMMSERAEQVIKNIQSWGVKFVVDIDDYWELPLDHALKKRFEWEDRLSKQEAEILKNPKKDKDGKLRKNIDETRANNKLNKGGSIGRMLSNMKLVDAVITTTEYLAAEVKKYNKNVFVIPNAIDETEAQFNPSPIKSDRFRIGWAGGSSHLNDLKMISGLQQKLLLNKEKTQMIMCGFDNRVKSISTGKTVEVDFKRMIDRINEEFKGNKLMAAKKGLEIPIWVDCEKIFSNNYDLGDKDYESYLKYYTKTDYPNLEDKPYRRVWSANIQEYAQCYNLFDVALAPLQYTKFNRMKSQLKLIEAGFHKKPFICTNISPYNIDGINEKNAVILNENEKVDVWYKTIKKMAQEPNYREDLGNNLYETVKDKYSLKNVTKTRAQIYKQIVNK